jgi:hypothetical protein
LFLLNKYNDVVVDEDDDDDDDDDDDGLYLYVF